MGGCRTDPAKPQPGRGSPSAAHRTCGVFAGGSSRFVFEHKHFGAQEGDFLIDIQNLESLAPLGDDVKTAVGVSLHHCHNFRSAPHFGKPLLDERTTPKALL